MSKLSRLNEIKETIQGWFGNSTDIKEVCDVYVAILTESEKQYNIVLEDLIERVR